MFLIKRENLALGCSSLWSVGGTICTSVLLSGFGWRKGSQLHSFLSLRSLSRKPCSEASAPLRYVHRLTCGNFHNGPFFINNYFSFILNYFLRAKAFNHFFQLISSFLNYPSKTLQWFFLLHHIRIHVLGSVSGVHDLVLFVHLFWSLYHGFNSPSLKR